MDINLHKLSTRFYQNYPHEEYPELLTKQERPYCCLTFYDERGFYICIPYRSNVAQPNNAYMLRTRRNSTRQNPGLDYSKIVIIKEESYIDDAIAVIDTDNYVNTVTHIERIKNDALSYVDTYINHHRGVNVLSERHYMRKYRYSSLQYFHNELGI